VADDLTTADGLLGRLRRWSRRSWVAAVPGGGTRADAAYLVVQRLADLAAAVEGRPSRPVPRLQGDLALADQLAVMLIDIRNTGDRGAITAAAAELSTLRDLLGFR
jgi:hypothetical protein